MTKYGIRPSPFAIPYCITLYRTASYVLGWLIDRSTFQFQNIYLRVGWRSHTAKERTFIQEWPAHITLNRPGARSTTGRTRSSMSGSSSCWPRARRYLVCLRASLPFSSRWIWGFLGMIFFLLFIYLWKTYSTFKYLPDGWYLIE